VLKLYDTIAIKSPYITEAHAEQIKKQCILRESIDLRTGQILYQITTGSLRGSYDSRISIKVDNKEWKQNVSTCGRQIIRSPVLVETKPFIYIECSVHKAMLGHNIYGGPTDFKYAIKWLIEELEKQLEVILPYYADWEVKRVDVAEVYELPSFESCQEWFYIVNNSSFPRRQVYRFGKTGLYVQGSTTTLKFYHKGPEFVKHDKKRVKWLLTEVKLFELIAKADCIIRVEVEIKTRKLEYELGSLPKVKDIDDNQMMEIYDKEVKKLLKEGADSMKIVRRTKAVETRLFTVYDSNLAGTLFGTWLRFTSVGEDSVKKMMPKRTFYRHKKLLQEAGVSWTGTDIVKTVELVPADFSPVRTDKRRLDISVEEAKQHLLKQVV